MNRHQLFAALLCSACLLTPTSDTSGQVPTRESETIRKSTQVLSDFMTLESRTSRPPC